MTEGNAVDGQPYVRTANGIVGQVDARAVPRYAGIGTFARLPQRHDVEDYDIAVAVSYTHLTLPTTPYV